MSKNPTYQLSDKYTLAKGSIVLSGIQALIRIPIEQHLADKAKGLNTATFISGYRGSPIGGLDLTLQKMPKILEQYQIIFKPGLNEELAATAVWGSQTTQFLPQPKYDGVLGIWYGKSPGVDRSGDALKHANFMGVGKNGGVLAFGGDDPISKSSTIPCVSEVAFYDALMPTLYPGNIQEVIDYGRLGFELSRYCGFWVGFKCVTDIMDGYGTAQVSPDRIKIAQPQFEYKGQPWFFNQTWNHGPPGNLIIEVDLHEGRLEAAKAFARANVLNKIVINPNVAKAGIITAGKSYYDLKEAFKLMGLTDEQLAAAGIRILKLGMIFPIEETIVEAFAEGLEKVIIIEEKRDFIENFITKILYHSPSKPIILGKKDKKGNQLFPFNGELSPDLIFQQLSTELAEYLPDESIRKRLHTLKTTAERVAKPLPPRIPYYCSGCPHNISTMQLPKGAIAGAGIGCHGMVLGTRATKTIGITHMGGEGAQWSGIQDFTEIDHFFQNIGDGTFFHSGSLALRQAVAMGTNITYKILYNKAVSMTGGQQVDGGVEVPELTCLLEAEGVKQIIVTTNDLDKYPSNAKWAANVERWHRDRIVEAQEKLQNIKGVTVLIHDQGCAAELRRMRKKGLVEIPKQRIFINEEVCEGCGDCGVKSNCMSVMPIETELGRKTKIHQSSCNLDFSCLKGDCPSFLAVIPDKNARKKPKHTIGLASVDFGMPIPLPKMRVNGTANLYMMGIGGTGVVTINQILGTAALLDGKQIYNLDQIGLSQKGGAVVSHFKITKIGEAGSNRIPTGSADGYIGFDLLTAAQAKSLKHATADKTLAVISTTQVPTGLMVRSVAAQFPKIQNALLEIEKYTDKAHNIYLNAEQLSMQLFGSHYQTNIIVVGAAFQAGLIPIAAESVEKAIELNGVQIEKNIHAFRAGRLYVAQPTIFKKEKKQAPKEVQNALPPQAQQLINRLGINGAMQKSLAFRIPELLAYQNMAYAKEYVDFIQKVAQKEQLVVPDATALTETVAKYLYKLMAYKDEYEVARLHTKAAAKRVLEAEFGKGAKYAILLHPPILRAMGYKKKIKFGSWAFPLFRLLAKMKFLRNTPFDIFGRAKVRQVERALVTEYKDSIIMGLENLNASNYSKLLELAALPDLIRGYEEVKLRNVKIYRNKLNEYSNLSIQ